MHFCILFRHFHVQTAGVKLMLKEPYHVFKLVRRTSVAFLGFAFFIAFFYPSSVFSDLLQPTPWAKRPSMAPDLTPSNPLGFPGSSMSGSQGSDKVTISTGMFQGILPTIPNLQLQGIYTFGSKLRVATGTFDYILPVKLDPDSTLVAETQGAFHNFSIDAPSSLNNGLELSAGGGYRKMLGKSTIIGAYGFFDSAKLSDRWYASGSVGSQLVALVGQDAIDVNFNWYGKALDASIFVNSLGYEPASDDFRFGNSNFDFQAGYSHELYNGGPDLRLSATGYQMDTGDKVYGYYAGAELKSRDGVFVLKYGAGYDNANLGYQSVVAQVNTGFRLEKLLAAESPFENPEPLFRSPRNLTRSMSEKFKRNWHNTIQQAQSGIISVANTANSTPRPTCTSPCGAKTITIVNATGNQATIYMLFNPGETGGYNLATDFPGWTVTSNPLMITTTMSSAAAPLTVSFPCLQQNTAGHGAHFAISANALASTPCTVSQAEFGLCDYWPDYKIYTDTYDISLVAGYNQNITITPSSSQQIQVTSRTGNSSNPGVYPFGYDNCTSATSCPSGGTCCSPIPGEAHVSDPYCSLSPSASSNSNYTVTFSPATP
jgi:hypothetical protein